MNEQYELSIVPENMPISVKELADITAVQRESQVLLMRQVGELGRLLVAMEESNRSLKKLIETRLTVTSAQAMNLQKAVGKRARVFCAMHDLDYAACGARVRAAIYRELKEGYTVTAYGDIPAVSYGSAMALVNDWTDFGLIQKLKAKK